MQNDSSLIFKIMKKLKLILHYLKIAIFGFMGILFVCLLFSGSYEYGKYLLNSHSILAACTQCDNFSIHLGFFTLVAGCLIGACAGFNPPKGVFFSFLVFFWLFMLMAPSHEIWNFSIYPYNYRYPGEIIVYAEKIRGDWIFFAWSAIGVLQVYLKPPIRKYVIMIHITVTALNAFLGGAIFN